MIEKHVTTLETSKRLKELGVKQESEFYWVSEDDEKWELVHSDGYGWYDYPAYCSGKYKKISAFLSSELGDILPANDGEAFYLTQKGLLGNSWFVTRFRMIDMKDLYQVEADTEANARAKILIYLLENGLIELE